MLLQPLPKVAIIAREKHKDGTYHLHIFLEYHKKRDIRNPRIFDDLCGKHCNITSVRYPAKTLRYIIKDDDYVLFGITEAQIQIILTGTSYALAEVAAFIAENPDVNEVAIRFPTTFIHYHKGLQHLCEIHRLRQSTKTTPFLWDNVPKTLLIADGAPQVLLLDWFVEAFMHVNEVKRPLRTPQLWLHGGTSTGKTRFLAFLCKHWKGFLLSATERFYANYNDYDVDFLFMDEFHGNKKLYFLNSLLGGEPMVLPYKGGQYTKRVNKPVIICSNLTPAQSFPNVSVNRPVVWEAFLTRILVLDVSLCPLHRFLETLDAEPEEVQTASPDLIPETIDLPKELIQVLVRSSRSRSPSSELSDFDLDDLPF